MCFGSAYQVIDHRFGRVNNTWRLMTFTVKLKDDEERSVNKKATNRHNRWTPNLK